MGSVAVVLCAAVVLPSPPLLVPEVAAGAAPELDELRTACAAALADGLATGPERVVLVGVAKGAEGGAVSGAPTLAPYGLPGPPHGLPLGLTIGSWLLDAAGWAGPRVCRAVDPGLPPVSCLDLGAAIAGEPRRTLLLALGDGTARRSLAAPGHLDDRAEGFDAAVEAALATGDPHALSALDPVVAADLLVAGRAPWQVLAGAVRAAGVRAARLHYAQAPYGVAYFAASWLP